MSHHCSPQRLQLLRVFFFAFTPTFSKNSQGSKSRCMSRRFLVLSTRVNTRSTSGAEHPPAVPDPRNPGPESELSRVCPDPCRDPGSLSPWCITERKIRITDKCTMTFKKWWEKGESFRVDRYRCIEGRCLHQVMSAKTKVSKTKTALTGKQETYNLSDLKHVPHCGFVEQVWRLGLGLIVTNTIDSKTF
jgi:hypothetical protein